MTQLFKIGSGVLILALLIWIFLTLSKKPGNHLPVELYRNSLVDSMKLEIEFLKADKESIKDSLFAARVEKGYTEIELNRSQSEVQRLIKQNAKVKESKDTPAIVRNCDSIVNELTNRYIPVVDTFRIVVETISQMQQRQDQIVDSIETKHLSLRNQLTDDLFNERTTNAILRDQATKKKKVPLIVGIGAFITGVILTGIIK